MKKRNIYIIGFILIMGAGYLVFHYYFLGNPRLILHNAGKTDIDSIHVVVSGNAYFMEKLSAGSQKTIRIDPLTDSDIKILTQNKKNTIIINTYVDRASTGGYIKAEITRDSLISFKHKRGLL